MIDLLSTEEKISLICKILDIELDTIQCFTCNGTRIVPDKTNEVCFDCKGKGYIPTAIRYNSQWETYRKEEL